MLTAQTLVYLDNNATTRVAPEVLNAMLPFYSDYWGNPSSAYTFGHQLSEALDHAREQVAVMAGVEPREICFTSGGTESINTALRNLLAARPGKTHLVTTAVEHSATLKCARALEKLGFRVTYLPVSSSGELDLDELADAISPETAGVSVMWANNETGIIFPIEKIAAICHGKGVLFHTDAVQAAGKVSLELGKVAADYASFSAHKLNGPKGVGALFIRRKVKFEPYVSGGAQERGRRGGTENVAGIVGFGKAAELATSRGGAEYRRVRDLRDQLQRGILSLIPGAMLNGAEEPRLANTLNVSFEGVEAEGVLLLLDRAGICASSGSACTTGSLEPSHVLTAMGCSAARARGSLRFSLGYDSTEGDVKRVLETLPGIIQTLREHLPPTA